jgi:hypothetical protein
VHLDGVGGGYPDDVLANVTLAWMMDRAGSCGLALDPRARPVLGEPHWTQDLRVSFAEFLRGAYRFFNARNYRPIGRHPIWLRMAGEGGA